ncbi:MAG: glycosyltransferase family 39 protein [Planctomycetes bacterium]|nr:glycosyltransferase family 39 protein [Planctomycetota bacterium]
MNGSRTRLLAPCLLILVIAGGLFLRLHGIGFLLPGQSEPDGVVYSAQVKAFQQGFIEDETKNLYAFYPHLVSRLAAGIAAPLVETTPATDLAEHVARAAEPRRRIRIAVALLSLLAIPAVWLLTRRCVDPPFDLIAAVFMAASFFTLWFAQQARPHAALSALLCLGVLAALHVRAVGGWKAFVCAGLAAGLAIGTLQSGTAVLPALALAVVLRAAAREESWRRLAVGASIALAIIAVTFILYYPFVFTAGERGDIGTSESTLRLSGHLVDLKLFNGGGFATVGRSLWEYDPLLCALAVCGILFGLHALATRNSPLSRTQRDSLWIVLAFVVPYTVVIGLYARTYQRFALPLVPFECALAAYALCRVVGLAAALGCLARRFAELAVVLLVAFQVFGAWRLVDARAQPSTIDETARWIERNVAPDARISFLPMMELPLLYTPAALQASAYAQYDVSFLWFRYLHALGPQAFVGRTWDLRALALVTPELRESARADPDAFLRAQDADYFVIPVSGDTRRALLVGLREAAARIGTRVARISPDGTDEGEDLLFSYQDDDVERTTPWFARGLRARCTGPIVEIYSLR